MTIKSEFPRFLQLINGLSSSASPREYHEQAQRNYYEQLPAEDIAELCPDDEKSCKTVSQRSNWNIGAILPVYVSMYAVTIQLLRLKPRISSVMATSDVATIDTSRLAKKTARAKLSMRQHVCEYRTVMKVCD